MGLPLLVHYVMMMSWYLQDKVLVSRGPHNEGIQVTNDGATILKSIGVDNPAAKVLVGKLPSSVYHVGGPLVVRTASIQWTLSVVSDQSGDSGQ